MSLASEDSVLGDDTILIRRLTQNLKNEHDPAKVYFEDPAKVSYFEVSLICVGQPNTCQMFFFSSLLKQMELEKYIALVESV